MSWTKVNESVKKVLAAKYWAGLNQAPTLNTTNLFVDLSQPEALKLNQELADAAVTVLNSKNGIQVLDKSKKTLILSLGSAMPTSFQNELQNDFNNSAILNLDKQASAEKIESVKQVLTNYEHILVSIHDTRKRPAPILDFSAALKAFISELAEKSTLISVFANPYTLINLPGLEKTQTLLMNYQNSEEMQKAAVKVINKEVSSKGKLPVNINAYFKNGDGL